MKKNAVVALVDSDKGTARAFHTELGVGANVAREILVTNASRKSTLVTDESPKPFRPRKHGPEAQNPAVKRRKARRPA